MGRLVEPVRRSSGTGGHLESIGEASGASGGDNFIDRVVKYIPGEVLATYLAIDRIVQFDADRLKGDLPKGHYTPWTYFESVPSLAWSARDHFDFLLPALIFFALLALTPLYFWTYAAAAGGNVPWKRQALISMAAFVVWAYAIQGGFFAVHGLYVAKYAAILVAGFTILSGFCKVEPIGDREAVSAQPHPSSPAPDAAATSAVGFTGNMSKPIENVGNGVSWRL